MAQSVGDLVVNLDLNSSSFTEQTAFVRKQFVGMGKDSDAAGKAGQDAFSKQELAAKRAGISVGQYKAAMRTLPAQFTDIATQLAGGQSPWLILLQQGGQIKDSFGGLRPTFSALFGAINPVMAGVVGLTAAAGALAYSFATGQAVTSEFNKALVMTGDRAGQTANNLLFISESAEKAGSSFSGATAAVTALAQAGANLGSDYQVVAESISSLSDATGAKVADLAAVFGRITSDPTSGLTAMAKQYGNVTAQQLDYVKSLQDAGKYTDALSYANGIAAQGFKTMAGDIQNNMGTLETAADSVGNAFKSMWNALLDIGRAKSLQSQLADATDKLYELDQALRSTSAQGQQRVGLENARDLARQQVSSLTDQLHAEQQKTEEKQKQATLEQSSLLNQQHFQSISDAGLTKEQQRTAEYQRLNQYISERRKLNQALSDEEIAQIKKGIEEKYKDPKTTKQKGYSVSAGDQAADSVNAETLALQTQLKVLQQHAGINDTISQQRKTLWETEAKFSVLEEAAKNRALSKDEQSLLASKDKVLAQAEVNARLGDQIVAQQALAKLQEDLRGKEEKTLSITKQRLDLLDRLKAEGGISQADYDKTSRDVASKSLTDLPKDVQRSVRKSSEFGGTLSGTFAGDANQLSQLDQQSSELEKWYQSNLASLAQYRQQRSDLNVQWDAQEEALRKKHSQAEQSIEDQKNKIISSATQSSLDSVVDITRTAFGEKSAIYKAAFIADKAYAIAQSMVAIQTGIAQAAANPFPYNLVAMASVAAATASIVSNIQSVALTGMAHDGIDAVPETGTWLLQKGERVMTAQTSAKLDSTLESLRGQQQAKAGENAFHYSPTIQVNGDPDQRTMQMIQDAVAQGGKETYQLVTDHIATGRGRVSKALAAGWSNKRRTG
ncbi:phage tail length tape measure family protein [Pantoea phytobeneficialis]|uniref:Phage tail length tape measure family protein n=1 Tax=Pantoea phytobeneficialis TaxID=2052056 RepID=A0AAP9KNS4_9GAMM|nr:phage tail length tape measure family protein [Pantoea phytobeneficialis]MDO6406255.1 phage tail length tape measure family protein [Pantoea phytobeneficialis]QGR06250.1 phage tail tape measure protein [Pantoea phytobeneficialis]